MIRKITAILLTFCFLICFTSCGGTSTKVHVDNNISNQVQQEDSNENVQENPTENEKTTEDVIEEVKRVRRPIRPFLNREYIETQERRERFSIYNIIKETVYRTEDFISFLSHLERVFDIEFIPPIISTLKRIKMTYDDVKVIPRHDIHDVVNFIMMEHSIKNGQRKLFDEIEEM